MTFGESLKAIRLDRNLTQKALGDKCGMDHTYICLLEKNQRDPCMRNFINLCRWLNCTPNDLLPDVTKAGEKK